MTEEQLTANADKAFDDTFKKSRDSGYGILESLKQASIACANVISEGWAYVENEK